jgi:hypothetical protein
VGFSRPSTGIERRREAEREVGMTRVEQLAAFVARASDEDLLEDARWELKIHVLDALGCAIGCTGYLGHPFQKLSPKEQYIMPPLLAGRMRPG